MGGTDEGKDAPDLCIWADVDQGADEVILFGVSPLERVQWYVAEYGRDWPNAKIYRLVEVDEG